MNARTAAACLALLLSTTYAGSAEEDTVAVMEFTAMGGVEPKQAEALCDLLATEIRKLGTYKVISHTDIRSMLKVEERKVLTGCTDATCASEIGGALGARWVVLGNVGRFGNAYLLNLKRMDVEHMRAAARLSKKIRGGEEELIDALSATARELFGLSGESTVDVLEKAKPFAYGTWGHAAFWSGLGLVAFGGVSLWQAKEAADDYGFDGDQAAADRNAVWNGLSVAGFVAGGALMATGAILWLAQPYIDPDDAARRTGVGFTTSPGGLVITFGGSW